MVSVKQLDAPIPGQALTAEPGNASYEHPPQFTNLHKAMMFLMKQVSKPASLTNILELIKIGTPVEYICRTLLFTGFGTGRWTPDLAILMYKPTMDLLIGLAHRAGVKNGKAMLPRKNPHMAVAQLVAAANEKKKQSAATKSLDNMLGTLPAGQAPQPPPPNTPEPAEQAPTPSAPSFMSPR